MPTLPQSTKRLAEQLLWVVSGGTKQYVCVARQNSREVSLEKNSGTVPAASEQQQKKVFLSYSWAHQSVVKKIEEIEY